MGEVVVYVQPNEDTGNRCHFLYAVSSQQSAVSKNGGLDDDDDDDECALAEDSCCRAYSLLQNN